MAADPVMRKLAAFLFRLLAIAACLVLSACLDVREEVWIHRDGSGRGEFRYTLPLSALRSGGAEELEERIRGAITRHPQLVLDGVQVREVDGRAVVAVQVTAPSLRALKEMRPSGTSGDLPSAAKSIAGKFDVKARGLEIDFTRNIDLGEALGLSALVIGGNDRRNRRLTYIIHLPKPAEESNATRIENGGRTLVWEATLGQALAAPVVTHFRAPIPLPWQAWAAVGVIITGAGLLVRRWWRRRRVGDPR